MNDNLARLQKIFREILGDAGLELTPTFSMADHGAWDSVATVQIVLAAELEFACRLPTEAVGRIQSVGDILRALPASAAGPIAAANEGTVEKKRAPAKNLTDQSLVRLQRIFREILGLPELEISPDFSAANHSAWDSIAMVQIILAIELEFACRLPNEAIADIKSVGDILALLPSPSPAAPDGGGTVVDNGAEQAAKPQGLNSPSEAEIHLARAQQRFAARETGQAVADLRLAAQLGGGYHFLSQAGNLWERQAEGCAAPLGAAAVKIAVLGSSTTEFAVPLIKLAAVRDGFWPSVYAAPFGNYQQEILNPQSGLYGFGPDFVILALNWRDAHLPEFSEDPGAEVDRVVGEIVQLWKVFSARCGGTLIQHNFDLPAEDSAGHLGSTERRSRGRMLRAINERLIDATLGGVIVLDFEGVSAQFGKEAWSSAKWWHLAKQYPVSEALPLLVDHYAALIRARLGRSKKVLVLDLDNTLWGGVIGEDGLEGIEVGPPSASGEAYAALQQYALELKRRGIVLAVCSKNEEADARLPFQKHEGMVLQEADFVVFTANWEDKPTSLRKMAEALRLGIDSFVFVDDNPAERARVRQELPEVAVVELGTDPADFVRILNRGRYFEALTLSQEDLQRHESYRANAQRGELMANQGDLETFLRELKMTAYRAAFSEQVMDRVVQLIGKTNQFNLTTRRHSAEAVRGFASDPEAWTQFFRLTDRFGDNGIVGLIIARGRRDGGVGAGDEWEIDTFLMSCRVIGRRMENLMMSMLLTAAKVAGKRRVRGIYRPTAKNPQVANFYPEMGFSEELSENTANGADKAYVFDLDTQPIPVVPHFEMEEIPSA